jgi:8-oxo-dGTP pyrophosphatase MutT (NUDIX family)
MTELAQPVLDQIAIAVSKRTDPHYPTLPLRLEHVRELGDGRVFVPDGPWLVDAHPKRASAPAGRLQPWPSVPDAKSERLARKWIARGGSVDQHGNLLHADWRQLLADPRIGLPTGPGMFWRLGANPTTDVVMLRDKPCGEQDDAAEDPVHTQALEEEVLLIQRASNGQYALPGGFNEPTDASTVTGGLRELAEETGLDPVEETGLDPEGPCVEVVHRELSTGSLTTLHAWTDTTVIWVDADPAWLARAEPDRQDADGEVVDALWLPVARLHTVQIAHRYLRYIQLAVHRRRMRHRLGARPPGPRPTGSSSKSEGKEPVHAR